MTAADIPHLDIDPYDPAVMADPYAMHALARTAGPIVWLDRYDVYFVTGHSLARQVLFDPATFSSAYGIGLLGYATGQTSATPSLLLETDPPEHDRYKKVMSRLVGPATLNRMRKRFEPFAEALAERLVAQGRFDAAKDYVSAFVLDAIADTVGLPQTERWQLFVFGELALAASGPRNAGFENAVANVRAHDTMAWVQQVTERANLAPEGLGAALYAAADAGELTLAEAQRLVRIFPTAAVDSTITTLVNGLHLLAARPDQWQLLHANPECARDAFEEMLRHSLSVQTVYRQATRDVKLGAAQVKAGQRVGVCLAAANRDPAKWPEPDRYELLRRPVGHLGFGGGVHACLGQMIARLEAELLLKALARRAARIEPDGVPVKRVNNALTSYASLPLRVFAS
jgi:cytochrome P450